MSLHSYYKVNKVTLALLGFCCIFFNTPLKAQNLTIENSVDTYDSLLFEYILFDSLLLNELSADSSSFLQLLDELMEEKYVKSRFSIRLGYSGLVSNAGRTIGINQYGFNTGISYYHKSGAFADISGYWNSNQTPSYNATITDIGYMGNITTNWSYWMSYSHYFFTVPEDETIVYPFTNALNASSNYYIKKLGLGLDYSFTFGEERAHRIRINTGYNFTKSNWWIFDRVGVNPNLSMLMGNANVITWVIDNNQTIELVNQMGLKRFRDIKNSFTNESYPVDKNTFGIMNYSLFIPLSLSIKQATLMVNYTLNIPVALPGEVLDTSINNYISATLMYTF